MPTDDIKTHIEVPGQVDPKDRDKVEKALKSKEIAPATRDQSPTYDDWKKMRDLLGQPFDVESIPLRKLRQMRRDPMIAFGLHYTKIPLVRASWHMEARDKNGPNAQVAAFMDAAWRIIHATYMFQHTLSLDFGYQAIVKRFQAANPGGVYIDPSEQDPQKRAKPVWDEGSINPIIWKPFVPLMPERVQPQFDDSTGEFKGILYELPPSQRGKSSGLGRAKRDNQTQLDIDVYRSLWATNDRDSVFGSIYGYARIAHAYRYWWSYWYNWAQRDRAFERMAVPPLVAYHPEGWYEDPENPADRVPYQQIALDMAERLRANAIAAVPSTLATAGFDDKGTQQRQWDFKFLETPSINFDHFNEAFSYLDVMKLRSVWVPEQAFIEGGGGTSSRNVAKQMAEIFIQSQGALWDEIADHINRFILPQILLVNFPEFVANGGSCRIVGHGFESSDMELLKQLIQLIGQSDPMKLGVDLPAALSQLNIPLKSPEALQKEAADLAAQQAAAGPPAVKSGNGTLGTAPFNPGSTNGGSVPEPNSFGAAAGFADEVVNVYIQPNEVIELSDDADFIADLPKVFQYDDKAIKALAVQLRKVWMSHYRGLYSDIAKYVGQFKLELSDDDETEVWEFGEPTSRTKATKLAKKIMRQWAPGSERLEQLGKQSAGIIRKLVTRALKIEKLRNNIDADPTKEEIDAWIEAQTGKLIKYTTKTVQDEMQAYLITNIQNGAEPEALAQGIREHFSDFPGWKASRVARSETRDAVNAATLFTAAANGNRWVRAIDGEDFDEHCKKRNNKLFTVKEAWKEMTKEHPYGTLGFTPLARANFSVENVPVLPDNAPENSFAFFDHETSTAYIRLDASDEDAQIFMDALVEKLAAEDPEEVPA